MMHPAPRHIHPSITPQERLRLPTNTVHKKLLGSFLQLCGGSRKRELVVAPCCRKDCKPLKTP
ncbi:hypothetical protein JMJ77_0002993 [Colletotrichum scovillei]|uniref:Uncharacterized protein n=1 Tax=Colletotrichum scovillei TaxID=1209932 RepID=A0A9P7UCQ2_9PEZI|nr:hypothetical protein JMJ77_0002993 [Colletotrichum scovillei]KAG7062734.1 hypothetical protein JMJ76_0009577 [Colletotrichum scovillei]